MGSSSNSKIVKKVLNTLKDTDFFVIAAVERYLGKDDLLNYPESIFITNYIPTYLLNKYITFRLYMVEKGVFKQLVLLDGHLLVSLYSMNKKSMYITVWIMEMQLCCLLMS